MKPKSLLATMDARSLQRGGLHNSRPSAAYFWLASRKPRGFHSVSGNVRGSYSGLLKRNSFCNPLKHVAFSSKMKGHHHLQGSVQVYDVRIPVILQGSLNMVERFTRVPLWGCSKKNHKQANHLFEFSIFPILRRAQAWTSIKHVWENFGATAAVLLSD